MCALRASSLTTLEKQTCSYNTPLPYLGICYVCIYSQHKRRACLRAMRTVTGSPSLQGCCPGGMFSNLQCHSPTDETPHKCQWNMHCVQSYMSVMLAASSQTSPMEKLMSLDNSNLKGQTLSFNSFLTSTSSSEHTLVCTCYWCAFTKTHACAPAGWSWSLLSHFQSEAAV